MPHTASKVKDQTEDYELMRHLHKNNRCHPDCPFCAAMWAENKDQVDNR
jgi:hypothetical protein